MNRFTALGLAHEAAKGKRILVLTATQRAAREALDDFDRLDHAPSRVCRVNGAQRIDYQTGGRIDFRSTGSTGCRGMTADTLYLDVDVDRDDRWRDGIPCIASAPHGEVVQA